MNRSRRSRLVYGVPMMVLFLLVGIIFVRGEEVDSLVEAHNEIVVPEGSDRFRYSYRGVGSCVDEDGLKCPIISSVWELPGRLSVSDIEGIFDDGGFTIVDNSRCSVDTIGDGSCDLDIVSRVSRVDYVHRFFYAERNLLGDSEFFITLYSYEK